MERAVRRTRPLGPISVTVAIFLAISGCTPRLPPAETFEWGAQPISFSPPPAGWERTGEGGAGFRGARFVRKWEAMSVAEYYLVGDRDRRADLEDLLDRFDAFDDRGLRRALQLAHWRTDNPLSAAESTVAAQVNEALDRATLSHIRGEPERAARADVAAALAASKRLKLSLTDVLDRVLFRPERRQEPWRYRLLGQRDTEMAGLPATVVDFTLQTPERPYRGREVYVLENNHLFVASYQGSPRNLALFDRIVATISFPRANHAAN
jgi:hypothetical protein